MGGFAFIVYFLISIIGILALVFFVIKLVSMIQRKDKFKLKRTEIKRMVKWLPSLKRDMIEEYHTMGGDDKKELKKELELDLRALKLLKDMPEFDWSEVNDKYKRLVFLHQKYGKSDGYQRLPKASYQLYKSRSESVFVDIL
jgi:hypothetical protein